MNVPNGSRGLFIRSTRIYTMSFILNVLCLISSSLSLSSLSSSSCFQIRAAWPSPVSILQCRRLVTGRPEFLFPAGWHFIITCGILNLSVLETGRYSAITTRSSAKKKRWGGGNYLTWQSKKCTYIKSYITIHQHVSIASATFIRVSYKNTKTHI